MAGLPLPIPAKAEDIKILCIADLEREASKRLPTVARGRCTFRISIVSLHFGAIHHITRDPDAA